MADEGLWALRCVAVIGQRRNRCQGSYHVKSNLPDQRQLPELKLKVWSSRGSHLVKRSSHGPHSDGIDPVQEDDLEYQEFRIGNGTSHIGLARKW